MAYRRGPETFAFKTVTASQRGRQRKRIALVVEPPTVWTWPDWSKFRNRPYDQASDDVC